MGHEARDPLGRICLLVTSETRLVGGPGSGNDERVAGLTAEERVLMRLRSEQETNYYEGFVDGFMASGGDRYEAGRQARAIIRKKRSPKLKQLTLTEVFKKPRKRAKTS